MLRIGCGVWRWARTPVNPHRSALIAVLMLHALGGGYVALRVLLSWEREHDVERMRVALVEYRDRHGKYPRDLSEAGIEINRRLWDSANYYPNWWPNGNPMFYVSDGEPFGTTSWEFNAARREWRSHYDD